MEMSDDLVDKTSSTDKELEATIVETSSYFSVDDRCLPELLNIRD